MESVFMYKCNDASKSETKMSAQSFVMLTHACLEMMATILAYDECFYSL